MSNVQQRYASATNSGTLDCMTDSPALNVLSQFAGIGGLELGLERAGMNVVGQVELNSWCRKVLAQHWPDVPRHDDVRTVVEWWSSEERPRVDVICGGFPCQDISNAGKQAGIGGERSGLWKSMAFSIRELRPRYVVIENVAALAVRGLDVVLGDLASLGFDAEWATLRASDFGAPHNRQRLYVVAYTAGVDGGAWDCVGAGGVGGASFAVGGLSGLDVVARGREAAAWLECEPDVARLVDGVPDRMDRLRSLGNAVVPQASQRVGEWVVAHAQGIALAA